MLGSGHMSGPVASARFHPNYIVTERLQRFNGSIKEVLVDGR